MADYWKSNPRYFCEVCKCWFGDNKISLEFHQSGRRHKANVERQLRETRKRAAVKEKEDVKLTQTLEQIEKAALASFQRDQQGLPPAKRVATATGISLTPEMIQFEQQKIRKEMAAKLELKKKEIEQEEQKKLAASTSSPWQQLMSPEEYPYYYNTLTGVSQWEPPTELSLPTGQDPPTQSTRTGIETVIKQEPEDGRPEREESNVSENDSKPRDQSMDETAESVDNSSTATTALSSSSAIPAGPYGAWTTIATHERLIAKVEETEEREDEVDNKDHSEREDPYDEEEANFKEKTTPTTSNFSEIQVEPGSFKGFSFKKRSKRSNIKERTTKW